MFDIQFGGVDSFAVRSEGKLVLLLYSTRWRRHRSVRFTRQ